MKKFVLTSMLTIIIFGIGCGSSQYTKKDVQLDIQNLDEFPVEPRDISKIKWKEFKFDFSKTDNKGKVTFYFLAPGLGKTVAFNFAIQEMESVNVPKYSKVEIILDEGNYLFKLRTVSTGYYLDVMDANTNSPFGISSLGILSLTEDQEKTYTYTCPFTALGEGKIKKIIPNNLIHSDPTGFAIGSGD